MPVIVYHTWILLVLVISVITPIGHGRAPAQSETALFNLTGHEAPDVTDPCIQNNMDSATDTATSSDTQEQCLASQRTTATTTPQTLPGDPATIRSYVSRHNAVAIQIKNSRPYSVFYYWLNTRTRQGQYNGAIPKYGVTATVSYIGHEFYVVKKQHAPQSESILNITVTGDADSHLFIIPLDEQHETSPSSTKDKAYYDNLLAEQQWSLEYEQRTGYPYLSYYDSRVGGTGARPPPVLHFWAADFIGQKHRVESNQTYWHCLPDDGLSEQDMKAQCQDKDSAGSIYLDVEVVSLYPKLFRIMGTISDTEAEFVMNYSRPALHRSRAGQAGGLVTDTRTSFNTWIGRRVHPIIQTVYNRAADVLGLKHEQMMRSSEQLQVLHYDVGQEYSSHHDFGANGQQKQRVMTLLFYLNDKVKGGETFFPKAMGKGIKVHPGKGNSALFYSILPDGNADDLSLHWALPVAEGEKWACNFWIWDPIR